MFNDYDFWRDCFKKSPIITVCMFVGALVGLAVGIIAYIAAWEGHLPALANHPRCLAVLMVPAFIGVIAGLVVGVILDSIFGMFRRKKKKKKDGRWIRDRD